MDNATNLQGTAPTPITQGLNAQPSAIETDLPTRIAALEKSVLDLTAAVAAVAANVETVAAPMSSEFQSFVDGLFSKYFRGEWEAFKAKLAANVKFGDFGKTPAA